MDTKRLILFVALSFGILFLWNKYMEQRYPQLHAAPVVASGAAAQASGTQAANAAKPETAQLARGQRITVTTDLIRATIDTTGGDLREVDLLTYGATNDPKQPFKLLQDKGEHIYVAQTGLLGADLPTKDAVFTASQTDYKLAAGQDSLDVRLTTTTPSGIQVAKVYTFTRDKYLIDVKYEIVNGSKTPLTASAYYRLMRDGKVENPGMFGTHTFTGPAVYTDENKFQKVDFAKIAKGESKIDKFERIQSRPDEIVYELNAKDGWTAMVQHYFTSGWIMTPKGSNIRQPIKYLLRTWETPGKPATDNNYAVDAIVDLPTIAAGAKFEKNVPIYVGPQETRRLEGVATGFDLVKDYGIFTIFSKPLFAVLQFIHSFIGNWGWAIIIVTILLKAAFFPLTNASYRSMAKMRQLAPRMEALKERFGEDKAKFQQAVMEMYKTEKVNPLGGCLPMLVQIPVFIAFYWMLLAAVELRQAPWEFWIHDLSVKDPLYILPAIMAISMYIQTHLSPPPPDPMQAKMMKIMPVMFSVFFFFFPAGLVLYWVVNNILSIAQQYIINKRIERDTQAAKSS